MAHRNNHHSFLTPDRRPEPDTTTKGFSTTAARGTFKTFGSPVSPQYQSSQINGRVYEKESSYSDKLNWFQSRAAELKEYLKECPKIEKSKIREIFNWEEKRAPEQSEQRKLLKQLGQKVRGLIKQNNKLKHNIYNGEITQLRIENERLKCLLDNINKGEASRKNIIVEENELMKDYIERHNFKKLEERMQQNSRLHSQQKYIYGINQEQKAFEEVKQVQQAEQVDEQREPLFNTTPLSIQRLKNLKQYFTLYVNTTIQENDQKFKSQQKYIDSLQKRITQLQQIDKKLQHLTFQRRVKLQQSERKSRNYTAKAPKINGDSTELEDLCDQREERQSEVLRRPQVVLPVNYYKKKQRITQNVAVQEDLEEQIQRLRAQNILLHQNLENLQQKYEIQIENHIKDISDKEKLVGELERLTFLYNELHSKIESKSLQ